MASIANDRLQKALDGAGMSPRQLADGVGISLQYTCDLLSGRRTLKRNPDLRKRIAKFIGVPTDWIEVPRQEEAAS